MAERRRCGFDVDGLLGGRLTLRQPRGGERVAIDAPLLAACVDARPGQRVLDVGCGSGAVALCLAHRLPGVAVTGIDRDPGLVALAAASAADNGLGVSFVEGDVTDAAGGAQAFDHVVTNPPFQLPGRGSVSPVAARARARTERGVSLEAWIAGCRRRLRAGGSLTAIFAADRLDDLLSALGGESGGVRVLPLWPKAGRPAKRVIVRARRGGRAPLRLLPGLVLHEADGRYTEAAEDILRGGGALSLSRPR